MAHSSALERDDQHSDLQHYHDDVAVCTMQTSVLSLESYHPRWTLSHQLHRRWLDHGRYSLQLPSVERRVLMPPSLVRIHGLCPRHTSMARGHGTQHEAQRKDNYCMRSLPRRIRRLLLRRTDRRATHTRQQRELRPRYLAHAALVVFRDLSHNHLRLHPRSPTTVRSNRLRIEG